jgi:tetratricopeptide (TPR) repeat protein
VEVARKVQVRLFPASGGQPRFGSGYLLAPRLVLTAAHILGDNESDPLPGEVKVSRPDAGARQFSAAVRWYRQDACTDAALIEVDRDDDWQVPTTLREQELRRQPPQRWGELIGIHKLPADAVGFPRMQRADDGVRVDEQLTGHIQPGTGRDVHRYEIFSSDPTVARYQNGGSRWSGMSGAAVVCSDPPYRDVLCGVVREVLPSSDGSRLTATPAYALLDHPAFRALLTEHTGWEPVLEPADAVHLLAPATPVRDLRSPAMLLRADVEAVRFEGRDRLLGQLLAWCESDEAFAVQVLTGPAGQGKTRLARQLTARLRNSAWITGHLRGGRTDWEQPPDLSGLDTNSDLLLVVDYAESRPLLIRHLIEYLHSARHHTRILLLARDDGPWREHSLGAGYPTHDILASAPLIKVGPLHPISSDNRPDQPEARGEAFVRASTDLAQLLGHVMPGTDWPALAAIRPPDDLRNPRYKSVLTLQMTALVTLLQHGPNPVEAVPGEPPEATLLRHEARYWEQSAKSRAFRLGLPPDTLHRAVATAALCGAATKKEAVKTTRKVSGVSYWKAPAVARWLRALYPPEPDWYWGTLQPDRIAEFHASRCLRELGVRLENLIEGASASQQSQTITVLARAGIAHYNAHRVTESDSVMHALANAVVTVRLHTDALDNATAALPYPSRVINDLVLRLAEDLTNRHRATSDAASGPYLADSLSVLGLHLEEAGRREEALTAAEEAVEIHRQLAQANPTTYAYERAIALSNLGTYQWETGRRVEALTTVEEAVSAFRRLASVAPAVYVPELATALSNQGIFLSEVGKWQEALTAEEEAVEFRERLLSTNPAAYEPGLAQSLCNLGMHLSAVGPRGKAVAATERAAEICRRLVRANPDTYEPDLARALTQLGNRLSEVGRWQEALTAVEEGVQFRERLGETNPAAYEPDLARSLSSLGRVLGHMDRGAEALVAEQNAVKLWARLAQANPAAYEPDFARSLSSLGMPLAMAGRWGEALTSTEKAVKIYRRLAETAPARYEPDLARSLHAWAWARSEGRQHLSMALQATGEAVQLYGKYLAGMPARIGPDLHAALEVQADLLLSLGRLGEAGEIHRWLAANAPLLDSLK